MLHNILSIYILLLLFNIGLMLKSIVQRIKRQAYSESGFVLMCVVALIFFMLVGASPLVSSSRMLITTVLFSVVLIIGVVIYPFGESLLYLEYFNLITINFWQMLNKYHVTAHKFFRAAFGVIVMLVLIKGIWTFRHDIAQLWTRLWERYRAAKERKNR